MPKSILLTLLLLSCGIAHGANFNSTAEVASWCQPYRTAVIMGDGQISVQPTSESQWCWGAFLAIQQLSATIWHKGDYGSILRNCLPEQSRTYDLIKVFLHYSDEHPERSHEKFTDVALSALSAAYPLPICRDAAELRAREGLSAQFDAEKHSPR